MAEQGSVSVSKRISANDLGLTGSHQAGIAVPKGAESGILSFFPALDKSLKNPSCPVTVRGADSGVYWELRFVYYNGKRHGTSTRDEYRWSGMTKMMRDMAVEPGDDLVFTRTAAGEVLVSVSKAAPLTFADVHSEPVIVTRGGWTILEEDA